MPETRLILLSEIDAPPTPARVAMDDQKLAELRESMRTTGLIQPIAVVAEDGRYTLHCGHRRLICAQDLEWESIRAEVYHPSETAALAAMLHENIFREDLSAAEEALLFAQAAEEQHLDEAGLCALFHVNADYLGDRMRLLRDDEKVFQALLARQINFSVARELNKCPDQEHRRYLLDIAVRTGYAARVIAGMVRQWRMNTQPAPVIPSPAPADASPEPAAEYRQECCICGGYKDPWAMVNVMIHKHELDAILAGLKEHATAES